jgi:hypothetical protein
VVRYWSKCGLIETTTKNSGCNLRGRVKLLRSEITFQVHVLLLMVVNSRVASQELVCTTRVCSTSVWYIFHVCMSRLVEIK